MKIPHLNLLAAISVALPLFFAVNTAAIAQDNGECLSGRSAQQAVEARRIISLNQAMAAAGVSPEEVINRGGPKVCDVDGNPYWQVNVQDEYGNSQTRDLPAQGD